MLRNKNFKLGHYAKSNSNLTLKHKLTFFIDFNSIHNPISIPFTGWISIISRKNPTLNECVANLIDSDLSTIRLLNLLSS